MRCCPVPLPLAQGAEGFYLPRTISSSKWIPAKRHQHQDGRVKQAVLVWYLATVTLGYIPTVVSWWRLEPPGFRRLCRLNNVNFGRNHSRQIQMQFKHLPRRHISFFLLFRIPTLHTKQFSLPVRRRFRGKQQEHDVFSGSIKRVRL